jgi:hypothetical protein
MIKVLQRGKTAYSIFDDYMRFENRIPSKSEFDLEFYGRKTLHNQTNYYYQVKKKWLEYQKMSE